MIHKGKLKNYVNGSGRRIDLLLPAQLWWWFTSSPAKPSSVSAEISSRNWLQSNSASLDLIHLVVYLSLVFHSKLLIKHSTAIYRHPGWVFRESAEKEREQFSTNWNLVQEAFRELSWQNYRKFNECRRGSGGDFVTWYFLKGQKILFQANLITQIDQVTLK